MAQETSQKRVQKDGKSQNTRKSAVSPSLLERTTEDSTISEYVENLAFRETLFWVLIIVFLLYSCH